MVVGVPSEDPTEQALGMGRYLSPGQGTGGRLKAHAEDFVVEEVPLAFPKPQAEGKYTVAAVRARNWETNRLIREIAHRLRVSRHAIFFAGTKDKRALTTQYLSVRAPTEAVKALDIADVEILEAFRVDRAPKIGELVGNRFTIRAREFNVPAGEALARARTNLDFLLDHGGFPNYFGPQRFGVVRPITHLVGRRLMENDLEGAFLTYVGHPLASEPEEPREARARFERERNPRAALEYYPRFMGFERNLLHHVAEKPGDYAGAFRKLPRNLLTMFVYAEQSRVFNRILTARMERGLPLNAPVVGDLVFGKNASGIPDRDRPIPVTDRNLEKVTCQVSEGKAFVSGLLPGADPLFADGEAGEIERAIVDEEDLSPVDFIVPDLPEAGSDGARRELLAPLTLINSDTGEDAHGPYLEFRFFLPRGTYATSLLREILRVPPQAYA